MVSYSIHVIVEYNLSGSEIISWQIYNTHQQIHHRILCNVHQIIRLCENHEGCPMVALSKFWATQTQNLLQESQDFLQAFSTSVGNKSNNGCLLQEKDPNFTT